MSTMIDSLTTFWFFVDRFGDCPISLLIRFGDLVKAKEKYPRSLVLKMDDRNFLLRVGIDMSDPEIRFMFSINKEVARIIYVACKKRMKKMGYSTIVLKESWNYKSGFVKIKKCHH